MFELHVREKKWKYGSSKLALTDRFIASCSARCSTRHSKNQLVTILDVFISTLVDWSTLALAKGRESVETRVRHAHRSSLHRMINHKFAAKLRHIYINSIRRAQGRTLSIAFPHHTTVGYCS